MMQTNKIKMNTTGDQSHKSGKGNPDLREHPSSYGLKVIDLQIHQGRQGNPASLWEHPAKVRVNNFQHLYKLNN